MNLIYGQLWTSTSAVLVGSSVHYHKELLAGSRKTTQPIARVHNS